VLAIEHDDLQIRKVGDDEAHLLVVAFLDLKRVSGERRSRIAEAHLPESTPRKRHGESALGIGLSVSALLLARIATPDETGMDCAGSSSLVRTMPHSSAYGSSEISTPSAWLASAVSSTGQAPPR
jgi:hypothetical protein